MDKNEFAAIFDPVRMLKHAIEQFWHEPETAAILREAQRKAYAEAIVDFAGALIW
jgi:hypothetical protein